MYPSFPVKQSWPPGGGLLRMPASPANTSVSFYGRSMIEPFAFVRALLLRTGIPALVHSDRRRSSLLPYPFGRYR